MGRSFPRTLFNLALPSHLGCPPRCLIGPHGCSGFKIKDKLIIIIIYIYHNNASQTNVTLLSARNTDLCLFSRPPPLESSGDGQSSCDAQKNNNLIMKDNTASWSPKAAITLVLGARKSHVRPVEKQPDNHSSADRFQNADQLDQDLRDETTKGASH